MLGGSPNWKSSWLHLAGGDGLVEDGDRKESSWSDSFRPSKPKWNNLMLCALGPNHHYFVQFLNFQWRVWGPKRATGEILGICKSEDKKIVAMAWGYGDSYLISYSHGRQWTADLGGYYPDLYKFLATAPIGRIMVNHIISPTQPLCPSLSCYEWGLTIMQAIALDQANQTDFILVYSVIGAKQSGKLLYNISTPLPREGIEEWWSQSNQTFYPVP